MPNLPDGRRVPVRQQRVPQRSRLPLQAHLRRFLDLRYRSVLRGMVVVVASAIWSFHLSHFPHNEPNAWLIVPLLLTLAGTADTARCMQKQWNWYHGGVVLCLYADLMALCMITFFLLYPLTL